MNLCVDIRGISEEDYIKVYEKLSSLSEDRYKEPCEYSTYVEDSEYPFIGLDEDGAIMHWYGDEYYGDNPKVYPVEEFLGECPVATQNISVEQKFSPKAVVYYTDGSEYTLKDVLGMDVYANSVVITYNVKDKKKSLERGITITSEGYTCSVEIDKQHLSGVVLHKSEYEKRVFSFSKLFANKFWTANVKASNKKPRQKNDVAEHKNTRPNSLKSGLAVGSDGLIGDRVKLPITSEYPETDHNPHGVTGEITNVRSYDVSPYIYEVEWDNGNLNVYKEEDLIYA